ncbi:hypothetical protein IQ06DRAFT_294373 [Phaeosphaeriaceae sp. SRC1lsM3a]|nr:hypothetical protein IQ06DRAFT_294373 [Stagonospora sp. SRC1lsM3a]
MTVSYGSALAALTGPSATTQWQDEQLDVPPRDMRSIPALKAWLADSRCPAARDPSTWSAIKENWISFSAATCVRPTAVLAPNRKRVRWASGADRESDGEASMRFRYDRRERLCIQGAIWRLCDSQEALLERWPEKIRLGMNRVVEPGCENPVASLMDNFGKQRRFNSIWTAMICFLVYCNAEEGALQVMGLHLSEDLEEDLDEIVIALLHDGYPVPGRDGLSDATEQEVSRFINNILTDKDATPETNPLLWWTIILVRSSLDMGPDNFISSGRFQSNILPMDLDIQQRIEGIVHFAKVFLLDFAICTWEPAAASQQLEVRSELNVVDNTWIGEYGGERPNRGPDNRACTSPAWKSISAHLNRTLKQYMGPSSRTPMGQIVSLRNALLAQASAYR